MPSRSSCLIWKVQSSSGDSEGKESACNEGEPHSISWSGRFPGEGNSYPLQYSCLENSMNRGAWWGYSPQGHKDLDMTQQITHTYLIQYFSIGSKLQQSIFSSAQVYRTREIFQLDMKFDFDPKWRMKFLWMQNKKKQKKKQKQDKGSNFEQMFECIWLFKKSGEDDIRIGI